MRMVFRCMVVVSRPAANQATSSSKLRSCTRLLRRIGGRVVHLPCAQLEHSAVKRRSRWRDTFPPSTHNTWAALPRRKPAGCKSGGGDAAVMEIGCRTCECCFGAFFLLCFASDYILLEDSVVEQLHLVIRKRGLAVVVGSLRRRRPRKRHWKAHRRRRPCR